MSLPSSHIPAEKDKVNVERKGLAPGRASLTEQSAPSLPSKKSVPSGSPASPSGLEVTEGSGNNISTASSPESAHIDGERVPCS